MEVGASHPMPRLRRLSSFLAVLAAIACWAVVPVAAEAAVTDTALGSVEPNVAAVTPPIQTAGEAVVEAVRPAVPAVTAPSHEASRDPVGQGIAPIADAAGTAVPPATAAVTQTHLNHGGEAGVARIAGASSVERLRSGRALHRQSPRGVARQRPSKERSVSLPGAAPRIASATAAPDAVATPSRPSPEPGSAFSTGDGAPGASSGFFFGGALALIVAALLLPGPRLRRQVALPPAVCRPAAFLVVLERPG